MTAKERTLVEAAERMVLGIPDEPAEDVVVSDAAPVVAHESELASVATPEQPEAQPQAGSSPQAEPETPDPAVQDSQKVNWEKRFKDTQAAYTKQQQRIAELEKLVTASSPPPDVVSAQKVLQTPTEPEGVAALRKILESNPELIDDPVTNAQWNSQKAADIAREVYRAERERDRAEQELREYAMQAKDMLGDDIDIPALENDARQAYAIHKKLGKPGNPFITAMSAVMQEKLIPKLSKRQPDAAQEAAARANVRLERSGPAVANTANADVKMTDAEYCAYLTDQILSKR